MKSLARLLLTVSLMISIGGHWGVLQAVAWVKMFQIYSAEKGLVDGLIQTFDGGRPCPLCKRIQAVQKEGDKLPAPLPSERKDLVSKWAGVPDTPGVPANPSADLPAHVPFPDIHIGGSQWKGTPPTPPPRRSLA